MSLAVAPPARVDLSMRTNDDEVVPLLWLRADRTTPVPISSAALTLSFDLADDDTWPIDPDTGDVVVPDRQVHAITSTTIGTAGGWLLADRYAVGEVVAVIAHTLWATVDEPFTGTWDAVAVSSDSVQRCLARGEFVCEQGAAT
jgi:hypothetical protein